MSSHHIQVSPKAIQVVIINHSTVFKPWIQWQLITLYLQKTRVWFSQTHLWTALRTVWVERPSGAPPGHSLHQFPQSRRPTALHSSKSQHASVNEIPENTLDPLSLLYPCCEDLRLEPRCVKALLVPLDVPEPGTTGSELRLLGSKKQLWCLARLKSKRKGHSTQQVCSRLYL